MPLNTVAFTLDEKVRVRHHLGYLNVAAIYTFVRGIPAAVHPNFSIEGAMDQLMVDAGAKARQLLCRLDEVEAQVFCAPGDYAGVKRVGDIEMNPDRIKILSQSYLLAQQSLANMLGVVPNPFDQRWFTQQGSMNVNVY